MIFFVASGEAPSGMACLFVDSVDENVFPHFIAAREPMPQRSDH